MVSAFHVFAVLASCLILLQISSSMVINDRFSPLLEIDEQSDESIDLPQQRRSAQFLFSPTSHTALVHRLQGYQPTKRHSFGRKHHWDAFFGRR